jgi:hypothetical protein
MVLAGLIAPTAHAATDAPEITPVIQDVLSPPRWYEGDDGRVHVSYALLLTNAAPVETTVQALELLDQRGRRLARLTGARLRAAMGWPAAPRATRRLEPFAVGTRSRTSRSGTPGRCRGGSATASRSGSRRGCPSPPSSGTSPARRA